MDLRRLKESDIDPINTIWEKYHKGTYGIPARRFLITEAVTENGNGISAYGLVRFFAEAMLYLDKSASAYEQAKSFKMLMEQAIIDAKINGLDQLNVDVSDPVFEMILKERFGFVERSKTLVLDLEKPHGK